MIKDRRTFLALMAGGSALLAPGIATAQGATDIERTRILRSLAPDGVSTPAVRPAPRAIPADQGGRSVTVLVDTTRTVDLSVFFDLDSSLITARGARTLLALGEAMKHPRLANERFLVAGHTDASGPLDHNIALSFRRANSVREHLAVVHGIAVTRLLTHGFGPTSLRDQARPFAGVNRRVEVAIITG